MDEASRHADVAGVFTALVQGADRDAWDNPTPVEGWVARDVVRHLVEWLPALLRSGSAIDLPPVASVDGDPVAAWEEHTAAVQALLEEPATAGLILSNPHIDDVPVTRAIDQFYTADVFMHAWDLARATGQHVVLDEATCEAMLTGMEPIETMLRTSGHYGPRVDVPADASAQDRLIGFIGRDPAWAR